MEDAGGEIPDRDPVLAMERVAGIFSKVLAGIDRALAKSPLNPSERRILRQIYARPGSTDAEVAYRLAMSPPQLSRAMKSMIERGLVAFEQSPHHKRQRLLSVTEAGEDVARTLDEESKAAFALEVERLAPLDQNILYRLGQLVPPSRGKLSRDSGIELKPPTTADLLWLFDVMLRAGRRLGWDVPYFTMQARWLAAFAHQSQYDFFPGWIAHRAGQRVGGCLAALGLNPSHEFDVDAGHATLIALYVHPSSRRLGIGGRLLQAAIDRTRELSLLSLRTSLAPKQERVIKLLSHYKFRKDKEVVQDFRYDTKDVFHEYVFSFPLRRPGRPKSDL